jgi:hypothetical protein
MATVPRHRSFNYGSQDNYEVWSADKNGNPISLAKPGSPRSLGSQTDSLLISSGHRAPYQRFLWNGSDFYKVSKWQRQQAGSMSIFIPSNPGGPGWLSQGLAFPGAPAWGTPALPTYGSIRSVMVPLGTIGWNRFRPGKPVASVSQFIAELRQLPKNPFRLAAEALKRSRQALLGKDRGRAVDVLRRHVGDQYLNWSFGWRPFLSDLEKIADFDNRLVAAMRQLRRDNGNTIRREGLIESDTSSTTVSESEGSASGFMDCPWSSAGGTRADRGYRTVTEVTQWRCWFSAGFVYHLPREDDPHSMDRLRTYLKGGGISPSVVWELTPWSWLADYFTNVGDVLENWEASRELALAAKYCYVMYEKTWRKTSAHRAWMTNVNWGQWSGSASAESGYKLKARTWASPYGLGFTSGNLNDSQKANLLALGLSRRI